jgi:hypothetical protein
LVGLQHRERLIGAADLEQPFRPGDDQLELVER